MKWKTLQNFGAVILALTVAVLAPSDVNASVDWKVFFKENSCAVTVEATNVIAEFANLAKNHGATHIVLEGNAGGEGSEDLMRQLSRCRGDAVKAQLVGNGIDATTIEVIAKGSSDPWPRDTVGGWQPVLDRRVLMYATAWRE